MNSKRDIKKRPVWQWFLIAVFAVQILLLVYYNLFHIQDALDADLAKLARHVMEMGRHRSLLVPNWDYMTSAEWDCAGFPAFFLYLLTGRIYLSFALANLIHIALFAYVVERLGRNAGLELTTRLLCQVFLFTAYDFGMLQYTNMLFFAGGQYFYKALLPLYFMLILTEDTWRGSSLHAHAVIAGYYALLFLASASSGIYALVITVFPIAVCVGVYSLRNDENPGVVRERLFRTAAAVGVSLAGFLLCESLSIDPNYFTLKPVELVVTDIPKVVTDLLRTFRSLDQGFPTPFSPEGLSGLLRLTAALTIIVCGLFSSAHFLALGEKDDRPAELIRAGLISTFFWNTFILALTGATPRYHIPGVVSLMMCAGIYWEERFRTERARFKSAACVVLSALFLAIACFSLWFVRTDYFHREDGPRSLYAELKDIMEAEDIRTLIWVNDSRHPESFRVFDDSRIYETYDTEDGSIFNANFYTTERDRSALDDRHFLITQNGNMEQVPPEVRQLYTHLSSIGNGDVDVYLSDINVLDGVTGFPIVDHSMDVPLSPGYEYHGVISEDGGLYAADNGVILESPALEFHPEPAGASCRVELFYNLADDQTRAVWELVDAQTDRVYATQSLDAMKTVSDMVVKDAGSYRIRVYKESGDLIRIGRIAFTMLSPE